MTSKGPKGSDRNMFSQTNFWGISSFNSSGFFVTDVSDHRICVRQTRISRSHHHRRTGHGPPDREQADDVIRPHVSEQSGAIVWENSNSPAGQIGGKLQPRLLEICTTFDRRRAVSSETKDLKPCPNNVESHLGQEFAVQKCSFWNFCSPEGFGFFYWSSVLIWKSGTNTIKLFCLIWWRYWIGILMQKLLTFSPNKLLLLVQICWFYT